MMAEKLGFLSWIRRLLAERRAARAAYQKHKAYFDDIANACRECRSFAYCRAEGCWRAGRSPEPSEKARIGYARRAPKESA
jgi:hypothetical protein